MQGVLNETTQTVHKRRAGAAEYTTACGATSILSTEKLRLVSVDDTVAAEETAKCGRCFEDAGGY